MCDSTPIHSFDSGHLHNTLIFLRLLLFSKCEKYQLHKHMHNLLVINA
jgi:hypothetical protein